MKLIGKAVQIIVCIWIFSVGPGNELIFGQDRSNSVDRRYWEGQFERFRVMKKTDLDSAKIMLSRISDASQHKLPELHLHAQLEKAILLSQEGNISAAKELFNSRFEELNKSKRSLYNLEYLLTYHQLNQEDSSINHIDSLVILISQIEEFKTESKKEKDQIWWQAVSLLEQFYLDTGVWDKALEANFKLLELRTNDSSLINQHYFVLYVQGYIYYNMVQLDEAKKSFRQAYNTAVQFDDLDSQDIMARTVHYIGVIYQTEGDTVLWKAHTEEAIRIFEEIGTVNLIPPLLDVFDYHMNKKEYGEAKKLLERAVKIIQEKELKKGYILSGVCLAKADYEFALGNLDIAIKCAKESMDVYPGVETKIFAYQRLSKFEASQGNHKTAYHYLHEYTKLYASNLNEEQIRSTERLKQQHTIRVKDAENQLLIEQQKAQSLELEAQRSQILWAIFGLGIALAFILYMVRIWSRLRKTNSVLKEKQQALASAKDEAESASKAKAEFLSIMSHEIRTPMNGVIGMTDLMAATELTEEQSQFVETISSSADSLLSIINDILDFSKIESGKMQIEQVPLSLRNCIEEVLDLFGGTALEAQLDLVYLIESDVPEFIIGDSVRIKQVLGNLVSNAIKFTPSGEVFVRVYKSGETEEGRIKIAFEVQDSGIGISAKAQTQLFQAFTQADTSTSRTYGGTGLGLTICRQLSILMGGEIWVESEKGKGAKFTFTINSKEGEGELEFKRDEIVHCLGSKKVLIVDENEVAREILAKKMRRWEMNCITAASCKEAKKIFGQEGDFDLLIIDQYISNEDGVSFYKEMKAQGDNLPPTILLGAIALEAEEEALFSARLSKPLSQKALLKSLSLIFKVCKNNGALNKEKEHALNVSLAQLHPLRILVAEDNPVNQKLVMRMLHKLGYEIDLVENGQEAWHKAQQEAYDLILMDVQMPIMDGLEASRRILSDPGISNKPGIIAITANATQDDLIACLNAGMLDRITKPFRSNDLVQLLSLYHERHSLV